VSQRGRYTGIVIARRFRVVAVLLLLIVPQSSWAAAMCVVDCAWLTAAARDGQTAAAAAAGETCHTATDTAAAERMSPSASRCGEPVLDVVAQAERKATRDTALSDACSACLGFRTSLAAAPVFSAVTTLPHPPPGLHTVRRI